MNKSFFLLTICMLASGFACSQGQTSSSEYERAERLRRGFNFEAASEIYKSLLESSTDEKFSNTLTIQIARCENGKGMLDFAANPLPQGHSDVPKRDFMLYLPEQKGFIWAPLPEILGNTKSNSNPLNLVYTNPESDTLYFSAVNKSGNYDIYRSIRINDTLWHAPEQLGEHINSTGDEILPVISKDGKELYFASNGQYGVGGFDLYISKFDDKSGRWDIPQNLGFPYSTPSDDYLLINDLSKHYSYLVSNRSIANSDSLRIYRLEYEVNPIKSSISDPAEALRISALTNEKEEAEGEKVSEPNTGDYPSLVKEVRKIQSQIDSTFKSLDTLRGKFASLSNIDDRSTLEREITSGEIYVSQLREKLQMAGKAVQEKELEFLNKGILIPRREVEPIQAPVAAEKGFEDFKVYKTRAGQLNITKLLKPEKPENYSFRIEEKSTIFKDAPEEILVYRIQLAVIANRATPSTFKGITPVFESKTPTGKWLYAAGNFSRYGEASAALQKVKAKGFRSAMIVAYKNGKSINVKNARLEEDKIREQTSYHVKISGYPEDLPASVLSAIRAITDKDVARRLSAAGKSEYFIGPFNTKEEAESLERTLNTTGTQGVSVEQIGKIK